MQSDDAVFSTLAAVASELSVHFIDVGQGDATLIDYGAYEVLIDGGGLGSGVAGYLGAFVDGPLEVLVATHPDADHIGGLEAVLNAFVVEHIWHNGDTSTSQTYTRFMSSLPAEEAEVHIARRGQSIDAESLTFQILGPADLGGSTNNDSIILSLSFGQIDWLFTGDAESEAEAGLIDAGLVPDVEILKVGHHGSRTASSPAFVAQARPETAIYMAGAGNSYGHPHAETISTLKNVGAKVYGTAVYGIIVVTTDGMTYEMQVENGPVPPTGSGAMISDVAASDMTAQGASISWSTDVPSTSQVEYGISSSYGFATAQDTLLVTSHSIAIAGLDAGATYHFRVRSADADGVETLSGDLIFTTAASSALSPLISGVGSSEVSTGAATIAWTTDVPSTSQVEYGKTTGYGLSTGIDGTLVTAHGVTISGLDANTTYHFRVRSKNAAGMETVSPDHTFTTAALAGASNVRITRIFYDGLVPTAESDEYVEITNLGTASQDITGWRLVDIDDGAPSFTFPSYVLAPGASIRVYTNEVHSEWGGFSFGRGSAVWNNSDPDTAALYDREGNEMSRRSY